MKNPNVRGFNANTRNKYYPLPSQTRVSGTVFNLDIPRTGLLARLWLDIRGVVNAVTSGPNALGNAAICNRARLLSNNNVDLYNTSGAGFHYGVRPYMGFGAGDPIPQSNAYTAITAGASPNVSMIIPVAANFRDVAGLMLLQNEQTLLTLQFTWETDAILATGGITWTTQPVCRPYVEWFEIPELPEDRPRLATVHSIQEDQVTISGAGQFTYNWPRGNTYMKMIHGIGWAAAGADNFTTHQLRLNQSDYPYQANEVNVLDIQNPPRRNLQRRAGTLPYDFMGSSGLGDYDELRDTIDSSRVTDLATVITAAASGTFYALRETLIPLAPAAY